MTDIIDYNTNTLDSINFEPEYKNSLQDLPADLKENVLEFLTTNCREGLEKINPWSAFRKPIEEIKETRDQLYWVFSLKVEKFGKNCFSIFDINVEDCYKMSDFLSYLLEIKNIEFFCDERCRDKIYEIIYQINLIINRGDRREKWDLSKNGKTIIYQSDIFYNRHSNYQIYYPHELLSLCDKVYKVEDALIENKKINKPYKYQLIKRHNFVDLPNDILLKPDNPLVKEVLEKFNETKKIIAWKEYLDYNSFLSNITKWLVVITQCKYSDSDIFYYVIEYELITMDKSLYYRRKKDKLKNEIYSRKSVISYKILYTIHKNNDQILFF